MHLEHYKTYLLRCTRVTKIPDHDDRRRVVFGRRNKTGGLVVRHCDKAAREVTRRLTLSGCHATSLMPLRPPIAIPGPPNPCIPPMVPAPPPYANAATSRFPLRSHTTVYPVLLAAASAYWTWWFHASAVISSSLVLRVPGEYGLLGSLRSQT